MRICVNWCDLVLPNISQFSSTNPRLLYELFIDFISCFLGPVPVNKTELELDFVENKYPEIQWGGRYIPPNCTARHKVAIIVPYRYDFTAFLNPFLWIFSLIISLYCFLKHIVLLSFQRSSTTFSNILESYASILDETTNRIWNIHNWTRRYVWLFGYFDSTKEHVRIIKFVMIFWIVPGNKDFNRAKLMNVGFVESQKLEPGGWQCFIFHDIDLLPLDTRNMYTCPRQPRHMSAAIDKLHYKWVYI